MRQHAAESAPLRPARVSTGESRPAVSAASTGRRPGNTHRHRSKSIRSRLQPRDHADHQGETDNRIKAEHERQNRLKAPAIPPGLGKTPIACSHDHTEKEITPVINWGQDQAAGFNQGRNGVDEHLHFRRQIPIPGLAGDFNIFALLERNAKLIFQPAFGMASLARRRETVIAPPRAALASPPTYIGYLPGRFAGRFLAKSGRAWISGESSSIGIDHVPRCASEAGRRFSVTGNRQ